MCSVSQSQKNDEETTLFYIYMFHRNNIIADVYISERNPKPRHRTTTALSPHYSTTSWRPGGLGLIYRTWISRWVSSEKHTRYNTKCSCNNIGKWIIILSNNHFEKARGSAVRDQAFDFVETYLCKQGSLQYFLHVRWIIMFYLLVQPDPMMNTKPVVVNTRLFLY